MHKISAGLRIRKIASLGGGSKLAEMKKRDVGSNVEGRDPIQ